MAYQFLPGCRNCGGAHPLARKLVAADVETCPDCGVPAGLPSKTKVERAAWGFNPMIWCARAALAVGRVLGSLARKV
jgi:hypothetical protein